MSRKILAPLLLLLCTLLVAAPDARASERHGDVPLATSWELFSLGAEARGQSGLNVRRMAVLFLEPDPGWYTYAHEPGGLGKPTTLTATLAGKPLRVLYPEGEPKPDPLDPSALVRAYSGPTPLFLPLPDGPAAKAGGKVEAKLELLLCAKDKCLPASIDMAYALHGDAVPDARLQPWWPQFVKAAKPQTAVQPVLTPEPLPQAEGAQQEFQAGGQGWQGLTPRYFQPGLEVRGLLKAVLLGLLAGLILNFMPCVLPVVSLKLSSLLAGGGEADEARRRALFREHNVFFALGILAYFLALSVVLGATGLAWGQLFQSAEVVLLLAALVFALSLSLFGLFSLPVVDLKFDRMTGHPRLQALFTGLLATLLATPCSGPFLGGVLGWTLLQPAWVISSVLLAVGLGMALPYLLLALFPVLVRRFPKPGPWTGHLEHIAGLLLAGTSVYLLGILPEARLLPALVLLWLTAVAAWLWGTAGPGLDSLRAKALKLCAALALAAGLFFALLPPPLATRQDDYSEAGLKAALGRQTVVVDFTADWCPSCKVLEQTTLTPGRLGDMKARYGLKLMRADLTEKNPEAEALLHALGSKSIPVLAIFPKNAPESPLVLRDLFTPAQLEEALKQTERP